MGVEIGVEEHPSGKARSYGSRYFHPPPFKPCPPKTRTFYSPLQAMASTIMPCWTSLPMWPAACGTFTTAVLCTGI